MAQEAPTTKRIDHATEWFFFMRDNYENIETPFAGGVYSYFENFGYMYARHANLATARAYATQYCPRTDGTIGWGVPAEDAESFFNGVAAADQMVQARIAIGHITEPKIDSGAEGQLWMMSADHGTPYGKIED